jgi:hypothetical protein
VFRFQTQSAADFAGFLLPFPNTEHSNPGSKRGLENTFRIDSKANATA